MEKPKMDIYGLMLLLALFVALSIGGYISYKSINYGILTQLESQQLVLPTPMPLITATPSASTK